MPRAAKGEAWEEIEHNMPLYRKSYMDWVESPFGFYVRRRWNHATRRWDKVIAPIVWEDHIRRAWRWGFTFDENGRLPIDIFYDVDGGQSGKSTRGASMTGWFGLFHEGGSALQLAANSREHVVGRVFAQLHESLTISPYGRLVADIGVDKIVYKKTNNTVWTLPLNAATITGGTPILRELDEVHAWQWTSEKEREMAAELKPSPARNISFLYVSSYPSYRGVNGYMNDVFAEFFDETDEPLPGVEKVPGLEDLPLWKKGRSAIWWNRNPHLYPWNTKEFIQARLEDKKVSEAATRRIWFAERVERENTFMPMDAWRACEDRELHPLDEKASKIPMVLGLDAGWLLDHGAGIARGFDVMTRRYPLYADMEWDPKVYGKGIITAMEQWVLDMHQRHNVLAVYYDAREFVGSAERLLRLGVRMVEVKQVNSRVETDTHYRALIAEKVLRNYPECGRLTDHVASAVGIEREDGVRLSKRKSSAHIDLAVADAMCCWGVTQLIDRFERLARSGGRESAFANYQNPFRNVKWGTR